MLSQLANGGDCNRIQLVIFIGQAKKDIRIKQDFTQS